MAVNLLRNSRVFFTTNTDTNGIVTNTGHTTSSTQEIQVLSGFSFSQNTNNETVTIMEAGTTPQRGQRSFNTSLAPVDFSFSTYLRPRLSTNVTAEEAILWNAFSSSNASNTPLTQTGTFTSTVTYTAATNILAMSGTSLAITGAAVGDDVLVNGITHATTSNQKVLNGPGRIITLTGTSITIKMHNPGSADITSGIVLTNIKFYKSGWSEAPAQAILGFHNSNSNQLLKSGLYVIADNVTYKIDNAVLTQATIDFGLDGIATIQWTGQATAMTQLDNSITTATPGTFGGGTVTGSYSQKSTTANYITNKLSTATLRTAKALGSVAANTPYYVAITGGSITINNNVTYITPENLGTVNQAIAYYMGTRSVTGTINAYLNTGAVTGYTGGGTGNLLKDMLAAASTSIEPMFNLEVAVGGSANTTRVELQMPSASLSVPAVSTDQVVSVALNFTAAPSDQTGTATTTAFDVGQTNELTVRYYSA